jgi:hypothetical protein
VTDGDAPATKVTTTTETVVTPEDDDSLVKRLDPRFLEFLLGAVIIVWLLLILANGIILLLNVWYERGLTNITNVENRELTTVCVGIIGVLIGRQSSK